MLILILRFLNRLKPVRQLTHYLKSVLRPDQLAKYEDDRNRRLMEASQEMNKLGVELPADWDELEFAP